MEVRKLAGKERFDANVISHIAFHMRMEDPEKTREWSEKQTVDDWGAFSPDGKLMAHIINHRFESFLDGNLVWNGGIGGVSTLPEYRNTGAVRAIFSKLLPEAYRNGEVISTLYPFNHAFYRKFGYETIRPKNVYEFAPSVLKEYRFDGEVNQWQPGDSMEGYLALSRRFAGEYNLSIQRSEERFREAHFEGKYLKDRKFAYMLCENRQPVAYVIFQDIRHDPAAILKAEDVAWAGPKGFYALLGFLARFTADYGTIELPMPCGLELLSLIHSPDAYGISKHTEQCYMIRAVNAQKLLEAMRKPPQTAFTIGITDDLIPENNGVWAVSNEAVTKTDASPDLSVDIRSLGQLAAGGTCLAEAEYREDVTVHSNRGTLESVFVRKPVMVQDHF